MPIATTRFRRSAALSLALAVMPATLTAQYVGTINAGMPVRIEIVVACTVSASDLNFGAYVSNQTAPAHGQTTIELHCGPDTVAEIALDAGLTPGNTSNRKMNQESGSDRLDYDLFQDAGRTIHWGERSGRDTQEVVTDTVPKTVTVYGAIPGRQRARDGVYSDTITVTVLY